MNNVVCWTKNWLRDRSISSQFFTEIDSTNTFAKTIHDVSKKPLVLYTQKQKKGRGRGVHQWMDSDFMATWTWTQSTSVKPSWSLLMGHYFYNSFQETWNHSQWVLKTPNDIYLKDKKVAGLLIEVLPCKKNQFQIIVGMGVNVLQCPPIPTATCIASLCKVESRQWHFFLDTFWNQMMRDIPIY